ncbi:MAG: hypothetical protein JO368_13460 [Acidimicrobiales bacterium]|nr:hypothetical protein [Acidimicrobiales bacterium]
MPVGDRASARPSSAAQPEDPDRPISTLRGAGVEVDRRRLGQVAVALVLVALLATSAVLFVAGAHHNAQADELRHGVPVEATVTSCLGLLGGSGSNAAGYTCNATYQVEGRRYAVTLPQASLLRVGSRVAVVAAASDPALIAMPGPASHEHSSWQVFIVPTLLLLAALGIIAWVVVRARSRRAGETPNGR